MKIALLGHGIETQSAYEYYLKHHSDATFVAYDESQESIWYDKPNVEVRPRRWGDFRDIEADIVVRPPSVSPGDISTQGAVTSVTNEFFAECNKPIIGVTGTKGKGTTSSLIAEILREAGISTWLVGNIGVAALDVLDEINAADDGVVVYELSSFQLWDIRKSPHVAVVLMIDAEHLDIHGSRDEYVRAKANIVRYQTVDDVVVYYADNVTSAQLATQSAGRQLPYHSHRDGVVEIADGVALAQSDILLPGRHNLDNIQAAVLAAGQFTQNTDSMVNAVRNFKGLPHRIEEVAVKHGVRYINDSFSSAPPATVVAVDSFDAPTVVIMGGYDRGLDFTETCREIAAHDTVKMVLIMGQNRQAIVDGFEASGWSDYELVDTLPDALVCAQELTQPGDVVVLSPGSASFDMFTNFVARGEEFKRLVGEIA